MQYVLQCSLLSSRINSCLTAFTGNAQITIQLIADYTLQIYQFLTSSVDFTSLLQFFQVVEQRIDPGVFFTELRCQCIRPNDTSVEFPWNCTETLQFTSATGPVSTTCTCLNKDSNSAFCDISITCPANQTAVGGRCNNNVQYGIGNFHFDDVGFGIPTVPPTQIPGTSVPFKTQCNAQVSRTESTVDIFTDAYCKAL